MRFLILIFIFGFFIEMASGQYISSVTTPDKTKSVVTDVNDMSVKYANEIKAADIRKHLELLASDAFEGRETGQPGNDRAANYIANHFENIWMEKPAGLQGYMQKVGFTFSSWDDTDMYVNGKRFRHLWDYLSFPSKNADMALIESKEVMFLGYGIEDSRYTDYKGKAKDFKDKVIIINQGEPMKNDSVYWISGTTKKSDWSLEKKLAKAKEKGVKLVLIIDEDIKKSLGQNRNLLLGPQVELGDKSKDVLPNPNYCFISTTVAKEIIGKEENKIIKARGEILKKGKFKPIKLKALYQVNQKKKVKIINSQNVLGVVPGSKKPDEYVIVTAHYDHLGKKEDQIFRGADDNGSGTSTLLELAEAMISAKLDNHGPERTVIFMLVTGEEKGLLGSEYYVNNPIYPLDKTVVNVNVDMIGRQDEKYKDNPEYIYVIGSDRLSTELHKINEDMNQKYTQILLDYTYNSESDPNKYYYRSDHYNFAEKGIPAIFFFSGVHADYHQPTDTADKINYNKMETIGRLIFHDIWELANRPEKIKVDVRP